MKKIITLLLYVLASTIVSHSQTIHWLTFIDTTDPNVGQIDIYGKDMLYRHFIDEVNAALSQKGYVTDIQNVYGNQVTPENCKLYVNMLNITNPDDIIVFYYIGHGGRPITDEQYMNSHPYPQLCLAQGNPDKFIPLEWIHSTLKDKGARLTVTIAMCCNSLEGNIAVKDEPNFNPNYGATYMSANKIKRIQELFLGERGDIIATSASPKQKSGCFHDYTNCILPENVCYNPSHYRDRYTLAICLFFNKELDNFNKTLNWDGFLGNISRFVDKYSNHQQTPIHSASVTSSSIPKPVKPTAPLNSDIKETKSKQKKDIIREGDSDNQDWINNLSNYLSILINTNLDDSERQELENELATELFADNAQVKFLGQDSDRVIDKAEISDWLGILSTNPNGRIINISVVEGAFDSSNKIKTLKVREIYKK